MTHNEIRETLRAIKICRVLNHELIVRHKLHDADARNAGMRRKISEILGEIPSEQDDVQCGGGGAV